MNETQQIIDELNSLQKNYQQTFDLDSDLKALQGVERCIELKMKVYGFDGKQPPTIAADHDQLIELKNLPTELLQDLLLTLKNRDPMKQQN